MSASNPNGRWGTNSVATSVTGATWVNLPDHDSDEVLIVNATGVALELRSSEATNGIKIPDSGGPSIPVSANSKEIQIRRYDQSNTQVTVGFIHRKH